VSTNEGISLDFPIDWDLSEDYSQRLDACFREGELVIALFPLAVTTEEANNYLLDEGGYFWNGKATYGQFEGRTFYFIGYCHEDRYSKERVEDGAQQEEKKLLCCRYLFIFQSENKAYQVEILARTDIDSLAEVQANFEEILAPGLEVLGTLAIEDNKR